MDVQWVYGPYDVVSFLRKVTYCVWIFVGIFSNAVSTVPSLVDKRTSRN